MKAPRTPDERDRLLEDGARLLAEGRFFQAHEAFEDLWHAASVQAERDVWQGLAQIAAALVKHERGEPASAITLLAKAESRLVGTPLLRPAGPPLKAYLDRLSPAVTAERELGPTAIPPELLDHLRRILAERRERAPGEGLS